MSEEKTKGISRREFLKDAGLAVGGATVGSMALLNACGSTTTVTSTVGAGSTVTNSVTKTVTTTVSGAGGTSTVTVTAPAAVAAADFFTLNVNGMDYKLQLQPWWNLAYVLRDRLGLFGTKIGCDHGACGSCTVLEDGLPVLACLLLAVESQGKKYTTIEGLSRGITLSKIQQRFLDREAFQCGYCTPGFIMAAQGLLTANAKPTADDVREAFSGHVCVCQNFKKVIDAVTGGV
jgi:xanthine dehydrogenase YagT iron-sulfur-binding subunit